MSNELRSERIIQHLESGVPVGVAAGIDKLLVRAAIRHHHCVPMSVPIIVHEVPAGIAPHRFYLMAHVRVPDGCAEPEKVHLKVVPR